MFGKRKQQNAKGTWQEPKATPPAGDGAGENETGETARESETPAAARPVQPAQPAKPTGKAAATPRSRQPNPPWRPDQQRRGERHTGRAGAEERKLLVGRNITMSGRIQACDQLVVEGQIEAELSDSESLEVTESGAFKGQAVIDTADIAGSFEGDLTVRERLYVRATGQVHGTIRYRALEIEGGGRVGGTLQELDDTEVARLGEESTADTAEADQPAGRNGADAGPAEAGADTLGSVEAPEPARQPAADTAPAASPNGLSR